MIMISLYFEFIVFLYVSEIKILFICYLEILTLLAWQTENRSVMITRFDKPTFQKFDARVFIDVSCYIFNQLLARLDCEKLLSFPVL